MKIKIANKIFFTILTVFCACDAAFSAPLSLKTTILKFSIAMFGVVLFSILLYVGLSLYNRFFVDPYVKDITLREDSLRTPKDKDEAVMMFISKNRLK